jgi:hypothetical protein
MQASLRFITSICNIFNMKKNYDVIKYGTILFFLINQHQGQSCMPNKVGRIFPISSVNYVALCHAVFFKALLLRHSQAITYSWIFYY